MVVTNIDLATDLFESLAIWPADTKPFRLLVLPALMTVWLSAMRDNAITVLPMVSPTSAITKRLELSFVVFLVTEALAVNSW